VAAAGGADGAVGAAGLVADVAGREEVAVGPEVAAGRAAGVKAAGAEGTGAASPRVARGAISSRT
jgi:hypothetical protein